MEFDHVTCLEMEQSKGIGRIKIVIKKIFKLL